MKNAVVQSALYGFFASVILLGVYFAALTLISGWDFAQGQFGSFWYFVVSLSVGFGIQTGLYVYLKSIIKNGQGSGKVLGATGTTSAVAMLSCCSHYLLNIIPLIGVTGIASFLGQYQVQFFSLGLVANAFGIWYISGKLRKILRYEKI